MTIILLCCIHVCAWEHVFIFLFYICNMHSLYSGCMFEQTPGCTEIHINLVLLLCTMHVCLHF